MTRAASWFVVGTPVPQGSLRRKPGSLALIHSNDAELKPWREAVATLSRLRGRALAIGRHDPVAVELAFYLPRKPSARRRLPSVKPDLDKLARAVLDGLTMAGVLVDDGQVCRLDTTKRYAERRGDEGVRIAVRVMDTDGASG